ncbi:MAG: hypothetical protein Q7V05_14180 [Methanoregula sp.]|nr:hypothetical protein [Methanoregula sp.]
MRYSGRNWGSDCLFPDRVPGFCESDVHANKKYRLNRLFREKNGFSGDLNLQFIGLFWVTFFDTCFRRFLGRNAKQMPLAALYCDHVGEIGVFEGVVTDFVLWRVRIQIFQKNVFRKFFSRSKIIYQIFFLLIKISRDFFAGSKFLFHWVMTGALRSQTALSTKERLSTPAGSRVLRLSRIHRHVEKLINLIAARMSENLGGGKTMMFKICDGAADTPVYAVVPAY